jgi:hypothetical protein
MQKQIAPDTSRDERILAKLRQSMSPDGWMEAISIAHVIHAPSESVVFGALERMALEGRIEKRILTGQRRRVEWRIRP